MSHFLKRLELNGFKSFAGRTMLEFPAGIVAVVGPNGSGKSNIVDSLRWLLGERDAKNLRGGKVEDLIFAGTQKRARVGMASASLYFENRNKFFPVDFEEVVITRQVSRGGESKYFLNKSEILLRDLVDFFAKARLGSRGLIIIGQGDSDLFIRSSPMERREMIEEILGLREYQLKKADAERRLKNSRINLDKTKALVEEILPHLRSLKRQTNRWERRGALEEELRGLETQYFGFQLKEIGEKARTAEEKIAASQREYEELVKALRAAEMRQAEIEESQPKEKEGMAAIKDEIQSLLERRSELQKDLGRLEAQIELAEKNAGAGAGVSAASGHSAERLLSLVTMIKEELVRALEEDAMELHATVENILEEINDLLRESKGKRPASVDEEGPDSSARSGNSMAAALKPKLDKLSRDLAALDAEVTSLREKERSFEQSQEGFYRPFQAAVEGVQAAKNKIGDWESRNREHQLAKERLDLRREEVVRQIEQAGRRPQDFEGAPANAAIPSAMRESDLAEMERRLFRLRGELASMGEVDQALMKEAQDTEARYAFLTKESEDLERAVADLTKLMFELSEKIKKEFDGSLHKINEEFNKFFALMFGGGTARLRVEKPRVEKAADDEDDGAFSEGHGEASDEGEEDEEGDDLPFVQKDGGVDIDIKLPRKKVTSLDMLSGGERSLVGIAALFAMVAVSPPPFLVLDEIDAPLDERNARRFGDMLKEFSKRTQFIVVTHNRATMEAADILYGVTLDEDGSSKVVSLKLESSE
jgi:chromosome segregation ATPase